MKMYKGEKAEKKILFLAGILVLALTLIVSVTVLAVNVAEQEASTLKAETIAIRNVANTYDVVTITFPPALPEADVTDPTATDTNAGENTQVLTETASEAVPVAKLSSSATYTVWVTITDTLDWNDTVGTEYIFVGAVDVELTETNFLAGTGPATTRAAITVWDTDTVTDLSVASGLKDLYLGVTLSAIAGKEGTSNLTILGES